MGVCQIQYIILLERVQSVWQKRKERAKEMALRRNKKEITVMSVNLAGVLLLPAIKKHSAIVQRINTPRLSIFANKSLEEWQA